jgi:flagellar hook protein FlgE
MSAIGIAVSGLGAAEMRVNASADNIVNGIEPGYAAISVDFSDNVPGGVTSHPIEVPNRTMDFATETIEQTSAVLMYDANAAVIRVTDQMYGTLLNMLDTHNQNVNSDGTMG